MARTDSREHILQQTFYLLLTKGYDGVSITDIQQATGMSRGLLYHYYGSKEDLFREAGERFLIDLFMIDPVWTSTYGVPEMIKYIIEQYKEIYIHWGELPGAPQITIANYDFLLYRMMEKEERIASLYTEIRQKEKEVWTGVVNRSLERNEIRRVLTAEKIAGQLIALLDGVWMHVAQCGNASQHIRLTKQMLTDYYTLLKI